MPADSGFIRYHPGIYMLSSGNKAFLVKQRGNEDSYQDIYHMSSRKPARGKAFMK